MFSTSTINKFIDAMHGKATYTAPANTYMWLSTTAPTAAGTNITEPSGNGYARVAVPASAWNSASGGSGSNNATIQFPTPTGSWGTILWSGFSDSATTGAGNMIDAAALPAPQAVTTGTVLQFTAGQASDSIA